MFCDVALSKETEDKQNILDILIEKKLWKSKKNAKQKKTSMVNFYRFYAKGIYAKLNIIVVQTFFSDEYWKKEFSYLYFKVNKTSISNELRN